jgi:hypothetical protein
VGSSPIISTEITPVQRQLLQVVTFGLILKRGTPRGESPKHSPRWYTSTEGYNVYEMHAAPLSPLGLTYDDFKRMTEIQARIAEVVESIRRCRDIAPAPLLSTSPQEPPPELAVLLEELAALKLATCLWLAYFVAQRPLQSRNRPTDVERQAPTHLPPMTGAVTSSAPPTLLVPATPMERAAA